MSTNKKEFHLSAWTVAGVALLLGGGIGFGASMVRVNSEPVDTRHLEERTVITSVADAEAEADEDDIEQYPKVQVHPSMSYNFGTMARDSKKRYTFEVRNIGRAPLTLEYIDSTCKCTVGQLDKTEVAPFESANVTLEWTADDWNLDFRQSARIRTNDHNNETISLSVYGKVRQIIRPVPTNVVLSSLSQQDSTKSTVTVYAYRDENFTAFNPEFTNKDQDYFDLEIKPLTDEQVSAEPNAKSGVELILKSKTGICAGSHPAVLAFVHEST